MAVPMKPKTNASVLVIVNLALLITTLSFKEVSATGRLRQLITDKSISVHSSNEAVAAAGGRLTFWKSLETDQLNEHLPNPPPPFTFVSAAAEGSPGLSCNIHVPTCPPTRTERAAEEGRWQCRVNEEL